MVSGWVVSLTTMYNIIYNYIYYFTISKSDDRVYNAGLSIRYAVAVQYVE